MAHDSIIEFLPYPGCCFIIFASWPMIQSRLEQYLVFCFSLVLLLQLNFCISSGACFDLVDLSFY
ncbi:hypothetical protein MtrunA17_Chr4g0031191 [Medicago truncatula]|uniref:Transmembrane protein n=1 Tax=Medicago truncatula TaxID=3880 RepID=A0A396I9M8_MEDTR|nr:hypothetical protein MtrunA17_Chr4g0031191 [Medicago truncatula]